MPGLVALMTLPIPNHYVHTSSKQVICVRIDSQTVGSGYRIYFDSGDIIVIQGFVYMKDLPLGVNIQPKITFAALTSRSQAPRPLRLRISNL